MFSRTIARSAGQLAAPSRRLIHTSTLCQAGSAVKPNSEGHTTKKSRLGMDVQSESAQKGMKEGGSSKSSASSGPYDTATEDKGGQSARSDVKAEAMRDADTPLQKAAASGSFKDHVGGVQGGQEQGSVGKTEEATPPSFTASIKQSLGMGTTKVDHQESKTGPGVKGMKGPKGFHSSARQLLPSDGDATNAAPRDGEGARKAKDDVRGDQNPHLKHKKAGEPDEGASPQVSQPVILWQGGCRV